MKNKSLLFNYSGWLYFSFSVLILLWPALFNGFPIVYPDTSTYLSSGFDLETPADRPITYGLFILLSSFNGHSLWGVVVVQSLILAYCIYLLFKHFTSCKFPKFFSFFSIIILAFTTGLPWVSGMLLPDVFSPITLITLSLLLFAKNLSTRETIITYVIFFLSNAMHLSHLIINVLLLLSILMIYRMKYFRQAFVFVSTKRLLILLLISLSGIIIMSSAMSKSKHIFYMGHMVENGILKKYLDENCSTNNYKICKYKDSLPVSADRFLWDYKNSPVYKMGGWKECKAEFNTIIGETFSKPSYIKLQIQASINGTLHQLSAFNIGEGNIGFGKETTLYKRIEMYASKDIDAYRESKQTTNTLTLFRSFNLPYYIVVYFALVILLLLVVIKVFRNKISREQTLLVVLIILGILYNDFVCATLSTVANRFACRIMWLLPLLLLMIISDKLSFIKKK